jgi:iron complex transport system ATP-binding protein
MGSSPVLEASGLRVGYRSKRTETTTLAEVDVQVFPGDLIALVGSNGAGKSTLLRSLTGGQAPLDGKVSLFGTDMRTCDRRVRAQHIALVLSERLEAPGLSVREVIALGRHPHTGWAGLHTEADERAITEAIAATAVEAFLDLRVADLSDGERQRVAIARAVAQEPDLLVLDEPTAFLDPRARVRIVSLLRRLTAEKRFAAVVATHDLELVVPYATQVWVAGDTRLHVGSPTDASTAQALLHELGARVELLRGRAHVTYEVEE